MERVLDTMKALADGNRVRVVAVLMENDELCVCQITELLKLAAATVSRHMSVLQKAGLVRGRKDGRWVYYRLDASFPAPLKQWMSASLSDAPEFSEDRRKLKGILNCEPAALCRKQKKRVCCA